MKKIGIFDSGVGGLSVVRHIQELLPSFSLIYFGDTARVPYGTRSASLIKKYATQDVDFIISRGAGVVLIGCNSASAAAYSHLNSNYDLPIISVIEPGAKAASAATKNNHIGVIGTQATINSAQYQNSLKNLNKNHKITSMACPLLVPLAETNSLSKEVTKSILFEYIQPLSKEGIDTLILGCTHYPHFTKEIKLLFPHINQIDPGREAVLDLLNLLQNNVHLKKSLCQSAQNQFYVSDTPQDFKSICQKFLSQAPNKIERVELG